ncbi:hypothetical protein [Myxococcus sp. CA039A]|uniref:hypothetical protein n=1 Tax=Myxococcus sp. CA039A TaxID=2741737 RepID=UPI00157A6733|nr:hypothetical protein [Myxococcus sp. CA039A]NTX53547.1 hypothetical protein [Myxococcus sp. CA039A]
MARSYSAIRELNRGRAIAPGDRVRVWDVPEECWFYDSENRLQVWTRETLLEFNAMPAPSVARQRHFLALRLEGLFVDVALYEDGALCTRGMLGGRVTQSRVRLSEVDALVLHYGRLGFHSGLGWNVSSNRLVRRELRVTQPGLLRSETVSVDGAVLHTVSVRVAGLEKTSQEERTPFATREEALVAVEQRLFNLEQEGLSAFTCSTPPAREENPAPPSQSPWVELSSVARPTTAHEAVDAAVALLAELHHKLPVGHFVVELIDPTQDRARLERMGHGSEFFRSMHEKRFGRWTKPEAVDAAGSSFDYFTRRYGTATWVAMAPSNVTTHLSGNVSGGGSCVLEINAHEYNVKELAEILDEPVPGLAQALVFHGGWHDGASFLFDRRSQTTEGEYGIHRFNESEPELPEEPTAPGKIQPFGFWLFERVVAIREKLVPALRELQPPVVP